jgi:hypothetical protein
VTALWAITSYFNPVGYERRLLAFKAFREALSVPLVVVEFGPEGRHQLSEDDADILVRVPGQSVLWQKERLLNIALEALPSDCRSVAWLDCDILFGQADWPERAVAALETTPLVQLYRQLHYLGPDWRPGEERSDAVVRTRQALVSGITPESPVEECLVHPSPNCRPGTYANGMAWAARRDLLDRCHFYDACVIGGGDRALVCAAYGCFEHLFQWHAMNEAQRNHYLEWARPFRDECRGSASFLDGDIYHQWHGDAANRGLGSRQAGLGRFDFDPYRDIALDVHGCWRWSSDKPEMHAYFESYFVARKEDG